MLERALAITRTGLDDTRRVLQALRATPIEDMGLSLALRRLAEDAAMRGRLSLQLDIADDLGDLSPEVEQCYYRVGQEAIENVLKHATASLLSVSLEQEGGWLSLTVSDDGGGFSIEGLDDPDLATRSLDGQVLAPAGWQLGIRGMQERAELIGGTLKVESIVGQGTTIRLSSDVRRTQYVRRTQDVRGENR
jgi:signal transduction histidine kinase